MRVYYTHDFGDLYTLNHQSVTILSETSIAAWETHVIAASKALLRQRGGRKWVCLISLKGFTLAPLMAEEYGKRAKVFVETFFSGAIRYGAPDGMCTQSAVRLGALKSRFPSNIFPDRETALAAAQQLLGEDAAALGGG